MILAALCMVGQAVLTMTLSDDQRFAIERAKAYAEIEHMDDPFLSWPEPNVFPWPGLYMDSPGPGYQDFRSKVVAYHKQHTGGFENWGLKLFGAMFLLSVVVFMEKRCRPSTQIISVITGVLLAIGSYSVLSSLGFKLAVYSHLYEEWARFAADMAAVVLLPLATLSCLVVAVFGWSQKQPPHIAAHKHSSNHRQEILRSEMCGCFYCLDIFNASEINEWTDDKDEVGQTALCPKCGIDSVIGSSSGYPITQEFLQEMKLHWFSAGGLTDLNGKTGRTGDRIPDKT